MSNNEQNTYQSAPILLPRVMAVYQPATPFRAVGVGLDGGEFYQIELTVLGIQALACDTWNFGRKMECGRIPREPKSLNAEDLIAAGYGVSAYWSKIVDHNVLIWSDDEGIQTTEEAACDNFIVVTGPATMSVEWWERSIEDAKSLLGRRAKAKAETK
jgi:hypothetical protein